MESIIEELLVRKGIARSSREAVAIYERLFLYVFKILSNPGIKRLTKTDLNEQSHRVIHAEEEELLASLRLVWKELEERVDVIERAIEDQQSQVEILNAHMAKLKEEVGFHASISLDVQRPLLDIPEFHRSIMRHDLVNSILEQMQRISWLALQGDLGAVKHSWPRSSQDAKNFFWDGFDCLTFLQPRPACESTMLLPLFQVSPLRINGSAGIWMYVLPLRKIPFWS